MITIGKPGIPLLVLVMGACTGVHDARPAMAQP